MIDENNGKLSPFAPIDEKIESVTGDQPNTAEKKSETRKEAFAQGLPAWNLIPKNSVVRRHRS